jgi:hypothetical protein
MIDRTRSPPTTQSLPVPRSVRVIRLTWACVYVDAYSAVIGRLAELDSAAELCAIMYRLWLGPALGLCGLWRFVS